MCVSLEVKYTSGTFTLGQGLKKSIKVEDISELPEYMDTITDSAFLSYQ